MRKSFRTISDILKSQSAKGGMSATTRRSLESSATINGVTFLKLRIRFKIKEMYY